MTDFVVLLKHELRGMVRTWRAPVIVLVTLVLALSGPALTKFMPDILASVGGLEIITSELSWTDTVAQWSSDLGQVIALVFILILAHAVARPISSGSAGLVLARPVSRAAVLVAPAVATLMITAGAVLVGAVAQGAMTALLFDSAPLSIPLEVTLRALALFVLFAAAAVFGAGLTGSMGGAAGFGVGLYFLLALLSAVPALRYSPAGLMSLTGSDSWLWAGFSGAVLAALLVWAGINRFARLPLTGSPQTT